jgi:hypothetical protein
VGSSGLECGFFALVGWRVATGFVQAVAIPGAFGVEMIIMGASFSFFARWWNNDEIYLCMYESSFLVTSHRGKTVRVFGGAKRWFAIKGLICDPPDALIEEFHYGDCRSGTSNTG